MPSLFATPKQLHLPLISSHTSVDCLIWVLLMLPFPIQEIEAVVKTAGASRPSTSQQQQHEHVISQSRSLLPMITKVILFTLSSCQDFPLMATTHASSVPLFR